MAVTLNDDDKFLILSAVGSPETANKIISLLGSAGSDVSGPVSSTVNAIATYANTSGNVLLNTPVLVSGGGAVSGIVSLNGITSTTLSYLDATSSIQSQLNNKLSLSGGTLTGPILEIDGSVSAPSYSHSSGTSTGIFFPSATELALTSAGSQQTSWSANQEFAIDLASPSTPHYSFNSDPDTGMYRSAANEVSVAAGGVQNLRVGNGNVGLANFVFLNVVGTPGQTNSINTGTASDVLELVGDVISGNGGEIRLYSRGATPSQAIQFYNANALNGSIANGGLWSIGPAGNTTNIHKITGQLQTPAAGALTLTNGPGASTGNPAVYLTLNINGTNYAIPAWTF